MPRLLSKTLFKESFLEAKVIFSWRNNWRIYLNFSIWFLSNSRLLSILIAPLGLTVDWIKSLGELIMASEIESNGDGDYRSIRDGELSSIKAPIGNGFCNDWECYLSTLDEDGILNSYDWTVGSIRSGIVGVFS